MTLRVLHLQRREVATTTHVFFFFRCSGHQTTSHGSPGLWRREKWCFMDMAVELCARQVGLREADVCSEGGELRRQWGDQLGERWAKWGRWVGGRGLRGGARGGVRRGQGELREDNRKDGGGHLPEGLDHPGGDLQWGLGCHAWGRVKAVLRVDGGVKAGGRGKSRRQVWECSGMEGRRGEGRHLRSVRVRSRRWRGGFVWGQRWRAAAEWRQWVLQYRGLPRKST